jgi:myo-inositol-1(or 4)-monophosphatase
VFTAGAGQGSTLGTRTLRIGEPPPLGEALVATGFGYEARRRGQQALVLTHLLPRVRDIRRTGAAAVDLCSVAAGRVDAYYETGLGPWDLAAGALIATEAGARVGALDGGPAVAGDLVISAHPDLFGALCELLRDAAA